MKMIKKLCMVLIICLAVSGCSLLDNILPELTGKDKQFCIDAVEFFEECANNLDGEKLKMFSNNPELLFTHEAALEKYGAELNEKTRNAYWATVIVNDLLPKNYELTDIQLQKMKIDIVEGSIKGDVNSNAFIKAVMSFNDGKTKSENIEICMHAERAALGGGGFLPIFSYIKFTD